MIVSVNKLSLFIWQALKKFFENVLQVSLNEKYTFYPQGNIFIEVWQNPFKFLFWGLTKDTHSQAVVKHIDFKIVQCVVIASPGFTKVSSNSWSTISIA